MPVSIRTLSQLPEVKDLTNDAIFEVGAPVNIASLTSDPPTWKFQSSKITQENLAKNMVSAIRKDLEDVNHLPEGMDFGSLCTTVSGIANGDFNFVGDKTFSNDPKIDNSVLSAYSLTNDSLDQYAVNYGTLKKYSSINAAPSLNPNYGFITHLSGTGGDGQPSDRYLNIFKIKDDGTSKTVQNQANFVLNSEAKNIAQMEYVFKIPPKDRFSNEWTAPASGIFTCYGWIDEINNPAQSNEARWVALLGWQDQLKVWSILQVQPFISNNYLSYVGFTFPVKKGMKLKIQTGFAVGSNSDKYFASNSSLANHIANAFLGGIYTGLSVDTTGGVNYDYEDVSKKYALSDDLSNYVPKDLGELYATSAFGLISALSNQISGILDAINADSPDDPDSSDDSEVSPPVILGRNKVNYIDAPNLSGDYPFPYSIARFGLAKNFGVFNDKVYQQSVINGVLSSYKCLSVNFDLDPNKVFSYKNYYSPPAHVEEWNERSGIVEYAYYKEDLPAGLIASDGSVFYYKVSSDCTLLIDQMSDIASPGIEIVKGWMLFDTNRGRSNIKCLPLFEKVQCSQFNGRPYDSISFPAKAGTIIMVAMYTRERIDDKMPFWIDEFQPPVISINNAAPIAKFDDIITSAGKYQIYTYTNSEGNRQERYAGMLRTSGNNINAWYGDGLPQKWPLSTASFGEVFYVYELP